MADQHERLLAEVQRRLEVARAATPGPWSVRVAGTGIRSSTPYAWVLRPDGAAVAERHNGGTLADADHIALHDPADAIRRYEADLRRLERHQPGVNGRYCDDEACSTATRDGLIINWPCDEVRDLAASLGVEVTDGAR